MGNLIRFQPLALAFTVTLLLSACGGGGGDGGDGTGSPSGPEQPPVSQGSEPVAGVLSSLLCNSIAAQQLIYVDNILPPAGTLSETGKLCNDAKNSAYAAIVDLVLFDKDGVPVDFIPDASISM